MRKLCLLLIPLALGCGMCLTSCGTQTSGLDGDSRSASIRVVVAPGGEDVLRTAITFTR